MRQYFAVPDATDLLAETLHGKEVTLRRYRPSDVEAVKASIEASFSELHPWFPWAKERPTTESVVEFIRRSVDSFGVCHDRDEQANYAISLDDDGRFIGSCSLIPRIGPRALEIGYWVDSRYTGRGIATDAARLLTAAAFGLAEIDRVEIHCDEANERSAAVARRVGCSLDRVQDKEVEGAGETGREMIWMLRRPDQTA